MSPENLSALERVITRLAGAKANVDKAGDFALSAKEGAALIAADVSIRDALDELKRIAREEEN